MWITAAAWPLSASANPVFNASPLRDCAHADERHAHDRQELAVASVEPSSTTKTCASGAVCRMRLVSSASEAAALYAGITIWYNLRLDRSMP